MNDSFVYRWINKTKGKSYLGYHKGTLDDGYICSSKSEQFWQDWETDEWEREILFEGSQEECVLKESELLKNLDDTYYNLSINGRIIFTDEVREKMRKPKRDSSKMGKAREGKPGTMLGKKLTEEQRKKISEKTKGRIAWNKGKPNPLMIKVGKANKGKTWIVVDGKRKWIERK